LIEEYNNSYVMRTDKYPKLLKATLKLLSNYQDSNSGLGKGLDGKETGLGASFAQKGKRDLSKVHSCKEYGHYASNCPNKKKSLAQTDSDNTMEEGQETTQMETPVRRRHSSSRTRVVGWSG
jgi:hypothetical protein